MPSLSRKGRTKGYTRGWRPRRESPQRRGHERVGPPAAACGAHACELERAAPVHHAAHAAGGMDGVAGFSSGFSATIASG